VLDPEALALSATGEGLAGCWVTWLGWMVCDEV
jgi:hypothetical protein